MLVQLRIPASLDISHKKMLRFIVKLQRGTLHSMLVSATKETAFPAEIWMPPIYKQDGCYPVEYYSLGNFAYREIFAFNYPIAD